MDKRCASPDSLPTLSVHNSAKLGHEPRSESTLIWRALVTSVVAGLCFIILFDPNNNSATRFLDNDMVDWKLWSTAALPALACGIHVLDLSTAAWTVSNGRNITVPGTLPSVVCLAASKILRMAYDADIISRSISIYSPQK